jgi:hypothetical protein
MMHSVRSSEQTLIDGDCKFLDQMPDGWFVLSINPNEEDWLEWSALVTDVDPDCDDLKWWRRDRINSSTFVRIPGKHETLEAACDAFEAMIATRH